ncbi:alpha-2-macroglobulin family protein [Flavobacterium okayamense]|uniref:Alpha-2-macroglobulin domain-containing protein n=1 Tax=Flavobacterium okayamense TaxID=2830782 RepID=A0ABM7S7G3_9FLAO|nr:alpha-2-macroglobulin family protein [Flavobacterium okayamense]BCY27343.1 hypothetical protein KK2020170_02110 [Flavobacterium okayamense]
MKKIITLLFIFLSTFVFSQKVEKEWQKVYQFENDGKFSSAQKELIKIKKKANRKKYDKELIKCFLYESKIQMFNNENAKQIIIKNLKTEIGKQSPVPKSVLHYILATILKDYKRTNQNKISQRSKNIQKNDLDFTTWSLSDFENEIQINYEEIFKYKIELSKVSIADWKSIFDIPSYIDGKEYSLYDFFYEKNLENLKSNVKLWNLNSANYLTNLEQLSIQKSENFINTNLDFILDQDLKKVIQNIRDYEKFYLTKDIQKLEFSYFKRIEYILSITESNQLPKELIELEKNTKNETLKQLVRLYKAENLIQIGTQKKEANYQKEAIKILDTILKSRVHPNILADAERKKLLLTNKSLSLDYNDQIYSNQNHRAFVRFKNIDTVKINYYRLPEKNDLELNNYFYNYSKKKDSLVLDYIKKHKPINSSIIKLPNQFDYFEHTTEIILDNLETGNYLIFLETNNSIPNENAYTYDTINVTDFFVVEDEDNYNNNLYILNRKTGQPIENTKIISEQQTVRTDSNGKASLKKLNYEKDKKYKNEILIYKDNDSIYYEYNRGFYYNFEDEDDIIFESKVQLFTDRGIYRPGQKIFFKGIVVQNKNYKKSVVPFVTVKVIIEDAQGEELKEFEIQTNELGSFNSEFQIPKNILTGQFRIYIAEPDNYENDKDYYDLKEDEHSFWDNVEFDEWQSKIYFQVEDYKRPTFEVSFDKIKENYAIGDTLKITGNAKALAGNNLTNAIVKYNISKNTLLTNGYVPYEPNYIVEETNTDEKGNFKISFPAIQNNISIDSIIAQDYIIDLEITDTNGETKSAKQYVHVNKHMLDLNLDIKNKLYKEDVLTANINTTTKNNYPIPTKVEIEIYHDDRKNFKKERVCQIPEIQTISKEQFSQLFPYEPYDENDYKENLILVKSTSLNTAINSNLDLSFLKELKNGNYKIIAKAKDIKENEFKVEKIFNLDSKINPNLETKLFSFKYIPKENSDIIEIEFTSAIKDLWITTRFFDGQSNTFNTRIDQLINGKKIIQIKKPTKVIYDLDFKFQFSSVWENQTHDEQFSLKTKETEKDLLINIESLKNKIEPGSNENWSFKINNTKLEAEVLASMYDTSIDQFKNSNWEKIYLENNQYPNFPRFYDYKKELKHLLLNSFKNYSLIFKYQDIDPIDIKWFGFNFNHLNYNQYKKAYDFYVPKGYRKITGVVSDDLGPVAGASVIVKGTSRGVTTDFDGNFVIAAKPNETLEVSYVGNTQEVKIGKNDIYNVTLTSTQLEEVVVSALGIKRYVDESTSSYTVIKSNEINQFGNQNIVQALKGKVSGLTITTSSNSINSSTRIVLRGNRSISGNNDALVVIDGEISSADELQKLSADSIDEVQVLKGAQGAALYGEQGVNGVIIVTTKKALKELSNLKTRTNFNETAFFYPTLKTDKEGKISFNFTTPESLTKWKLRLFAHNKNYETGFLESSIISQKEVMVQTNMPRFFRENDNIKISAKIVNMTDETKSGVAMLMLFNAENNETIDSIALNNDNLKNFSCKPKESVPVNWTISIPKNISGLQYKIVAKSSNFSDGEENIIPVLSNKILVTESRPIWLKGNAKKEIVFEKLLNNSSTSLENQKYTLEYSSNPLWIVLQSLPYLMEFEHECAEQTFARYYANLIAGEIIEDNEKINSVLESWKNNDVSSKFNFNEDLKSIALNETPWLFDVESDEEKNMKLALLLDLNNLEKNQENTLNKLLEKQNINGSFSWFKGGNENIFITQHILAGFGHLSQMFPHKKQEFKKITYKTVVYLDNKFISDNSINKKYSNNYLNLHFWYARSFYLEDFPINENLKIIFNKQFESFKKEWLTYSLYQKGLAAICLQRIGEKEWAKKIITHLKETASVNEEKGMYWLENDHGYYWYQSPIETQAILIEAFDEIEKDKKYIEELKTWLLFKKQANHWPTTKSTSEAIYALLLQGEDWLSEKENVKFVIGNSKISSKKITESEKQNETGYTKINWNKEDISNDMGKVSINNKGEVPVFGGIYWQYFENLENVKADSTLVININKKLFKKIKTPEGNNLVEITNNNIKTGDLITIKLTVRVKENLEFVHLKDSRASCFEPIDVISEYQYEDGAYFYKSTRDTATHFFFDDLSKGTYILEYDVRITNLGSFTDGIATIQSMYAPEFNSHSSASKITIE